MRVGGTSGLLANALNKAAEEYKVPVKAAAGGYGAHREMLPEFDLVILAPQVASNFEDMKAETDKLGIKLAKTEGAQYIKLTRDGKRCSRISFRRNSINDRDCETVSYRNGNRYGDFPNRFVNSSVKIYRFYSSCHNSVAWNKK